MNDAKEIYQAVLEETTKKIDQIKSEYGRDIYQWIEALIKEECSGKIEKLESENAEFRRRLSEVERQLGQLDKGGYKNFETILEGELIDRTKKAGSSGKRIDVSRIYGAFEFNGWLYYANEKMGDFLYRVRTDGTGNEQLTDYSVLYMRSCAKVQNGKLYFEDKEFRERSINL